MTARNLQYAPSTRESLQAAYKFAEPHLRPVIGAVRDNRAGLLFVAQDSAPFDLPNDPKRPAIIIIGDDFDKSVGPSGFDLPSIRRAVASCCSLAVVSSGAIPEPYAAVTLSAVLMRKNAMLVETRLEHEIEWVNFIRATSPSAPLLISTVKGGRA